MPKPHQIATHAKPSLDRKAEAKHPAVEKALEPHSMMALLTMDLRLVKAVELIERSCGPYARRLLLSGHTALRSEAIGTLSRTSPEYQLHVLDHIRAGHPKPLKKTACCVLVYETVSFREVVSRLERALGSVRREVAFVNAQIDADKVSLDRGPDRLLTLALVVEIARAIADSIRRFFGIESTPFSTWREVEVEREPSPVVPSRLNAASALGLLTKNARNLPLLKPEHHPTGMEQRQALDLCDGIEAQARPALRSARKRWGMLDAQLRVRPSGAVTRRIITHADQDGDALVAAWLAERYLFAGEAVEILFVPRERVLGCLRIGDCLVDVGNTFDPARHLFDHKPSATHTASCLTATSARRWTTPCSMGSLSPMPGTPCPRSSPCLRPRATEWCGRCWRGFCRSPGRPPSGPGWTLSTSGCGRSRTWKSGPPGRTTTMASSGGPTQSSSMRPAT